MAQRKSDDRGREPQSYGSEKDWLTGNTDQSVNHTQERTSRHDEAFYEERIDDRKSSEGIGGKVSPQRDDVSDPQVSHRNATAAEQPVMKVSTRTGGRSSYFKDRDYTK